MRAFAQRQSKLSKIRSYYNDTWIWQLQFLTVWKILDSGGSIQYQSFLTCLGSWQPTPCPVWRKRLQSELIFPSSKSLEHGAAQSTYDEWRNEWMGPTQPGSDWAFCKNEQEGPKVIILFQIQLAWSFFSCKIKTKPNQTKTLSWGITLSFPSLSHLQSTPLGQLAREGAQGSWPFPLWPNITSSPHFDQMPGILSTGGQSLSSANYW